MRCTRQFAQRRLEHPAGISPQVSVGRAQADAAAGHRHDGLDANQYFLPRSANRGQGVRRTQPGGTVCLDYETPRHRAARRVESPAETAGTRLDASHYLRSVGWRITQLKTDNDEKATERMAVPPVRTPNVRRGFCRTALLFRCKVKDATLQRGAGTSMRPMRQMRSGNSTLRYSPLTVTQRGMVY